MEFPNKNFHHKLVRFEQIQMIHMAQNLELFDKKLSNMLSIFEIKLALFCGIILKEAYVSETIK